MKKLKQSTKEMLWMSVANLFLIIAAIDSLIFLNRADYMLAIAASVIGLINAWSAFNSYKNWKIAKKVEETFQENVSKVLSNKNIAQEWVKKDR
jgi:hypothetical protein